MASPCLTPRPSRRPTRSLLVRETCPPLLLFPSDDVRPLDEGVANGIGSSAGWLLSAYLLGGFGDDAKGSNGVGNAVTVAAKSWAVGIPVICLLLAPVLKTQTRPSFHN